MTTAELGSRPEARAGALPSFWRRFAPGQICWTAVGILCGISGGTGYYLIAILLPKEPVDQGTAVAASFGLSTLVFAASVPGKLFNGYIMEIVGRRWTITGSFVLAIPGLLMMMTAHRMGSAAPVVFEAGTPITGFTVLSCFPAVRMYLAFWYFQAAVAFWLLGFETRGRTFEEIDASLSMPDVLAVTDGRSASRP